MYIKQILINYEGNGTMNMTDKESRQNIQFLMYTKEHPFTAIM